MLGALLRLLIDTIGGETKCKIRRNPKKRKKVSNDAGYRHIWPYGRGGDQM